MLNSRTLKESRTWLLVCTRHCYFIPFNHEHPVGHAAYQSMRLDNYKKKHLSRYQPHVYISMPAKFMVKK